MLGGCLSGSRVQIGELNRILQHLKSSALF